MKGVQKRPFFESLKSQPAVTDLSFLLNRNLGERFIEMRQVKYRIVPKTLFAPRGKPNFSRHYPFEKLSWPFSVIITKDTAKPRVPRSIHAFELRLNQGKTLRP